MTDQPRRDPDTLTPAPGREDGCTPTSEGGGVSRRVVLQHAASAAGLVALGLLVPGTETRAASEPSGPAAPPGNEPESAPGGSSQSRPAGGEAAGGRLLVGYCGIYCGLCEKRGRIPERAASLLEAMRKAEYGAPAQTWESLEKMAQPASDMCCRTGKCGAPFCALRKCVRAKGLEVCPQCEQYPCERVRLFGTSEPLLLADGHRIRERGLDSWIEEQERRRQDGFCYADIRCYPYHYPRE